VKPYLHSLNTPSWRGAQLPKNRDNFTFTFTFKFSGGTLLGYKHFIIEKFWEKSEGNFISRDLETRLYCPW